MHHQTIALVCKAQQHDSSQAGALSERYYPPETSLTTPRTKSHDCLWPWLLAHTVLLEGVGGRGVLCTVQSP